MRRKNRLIGEVIFQSSGARYTEPWFRQGDKVQFTINMQNLVGTTPSLAIDIQHKNIVDPETSWATLASFTAVTTTGFKNKDATTGIKEMVRLALTLSSGASGAIGAIVIFDPVWSSG